MNYQKPLIASLVVSLTLFLHSASAWAGTWSNPAKIIQIGAWGPWFGVVLTDDQAAAHGCAGTGPKAIDISTSTPTKNAQMSLLLAAYASGKSIKLYYENCVQEVSIITNAQVIDD